MPKPRTIPRRSLSTSTARFWSTKDGDEVLAEGFERAEVERFCDVDVTNGERAAQSVRLEALGVHDCFETHVYRTE